MSTSELRDICDALAERDSEEEGGGLEGSGGRSAWEKRREAAKRSRGTPSSAVGREGLGLAPFPTLIEPFQFHTFVLVQKGWTG